MSLTEARETLAAALIAQETAHTTHAAADAALRDALAARHHADSVVEQAKRALWLAEARDALPTGDAVEIIVDTRRTLTILEGRADAGGLRLVHRDQHLHGGTRFQERRETIRPSKWGHDYNDWCRRLKVAP